MAFETIAVCGLGTSLGMSTDDLGFRLRYFLGVSPNGWFVMEDPIEIDENWGYHGVPFFWSPKRGELPSPVEVLWLL